MARHTDREYEGELRKVRECLLLMGGRVEQRITQSMRALVERDATLAHETVLLDREVNRLEIETDELCTRILARRQPVAADLRFLTTALKLVTDLERMGDLCANVCDHTIALGDHPPTPEQERLPAMGTLVGEMVRDGLDAFVHADVDKARAVVERDRELDDSYARMSAEVVSLMAQEPAKIAVRLHVQSVGRALERIGDHATNIAERVVYLVSGVDIRHTGRKTEAGDTGPRVVLFLCGENAVESQMAQAWARRLFRGGVRIFSAGTRPADQVDPRAAEVMKEVGIELAPERPKRLSDVPISEVDTLVRLSNEPLPTALAASARVETWGLPLLETSGDRERVLMTYREVRDEIGRRVRALALAG